jgi:hypothetical protein
MVFDNLNQGNHFLHKKYIRKGFLGIDITEFDNKIDNIMANHSTDGVKTFMLELDGPS